MSLRQLSNLRGISGQENEVKNFIVNEIEGHCDSFWTDTIGNLYVVAKGDGNARISLYAHMDEVGLMVTGIKDGLLTFDVVGGINAELLPGTPVSVGREGMVGVIGCPPKHLQKSVDLKKKIPIDDLRIDIGDVNDAIQIGDMATFRTEYREYNGLAFGKAFDDRVGCHCLLEMIRSDPGISCTYVFTVQEEVGLRGSRVAANNVECDYAIACEGTFSLDHPGVPPEDRAPRFGCGPVITIADRSIITDKELRETIVSTASDHSIPYQYKRPFTGGTDAGMAHLSGPGVPSCVISNPCKYIHSPCAIAAIKDIENTARLIRESAIRISEGL